MVSSSAHAFQRKDGSGTVVRVQHEIATQPGVVLFEQYLSPSENPEVKVEGDKVTAYPQLPQFHTLTLKVTRYRMDRERLVVTAGEEITGPESASG
ncbi:MAG: hypothetical protein KIT44_01875 [Opitutaceae bacterium]|nr:hypothetical protein [Opitutaceae bacterium]